MPSPFPGMDPWLEGPESFPDIHDALIFLLREALNAAMPAGYIARGTQLVWVDDQTRREPDVTVTGTDRNGWGGAATALAGLVALGEPPTPEPREEPYLEIVTAQGRRLVTAVEVLSPTNKTPGGAGRRAYQEKQDEFRLGGVNVVEIDLLRGGAHTTLVPPDLLRRRAGRFDYHVGVVVAGDPGGLYAAAIALADRLPAFGIPLDPGVPPVTVDLQPLLDRAYDTGRYAQLVRYDRPADPPLTPDQQAWAAGVLRTRGLMPAPSEEPR